MDLDSKLDTDLDELASRRSGSSGRVSRVAAGRRQRRDGGPKGPVAENSRVYVQNLDWGVSWQDLKDHMRQAGEVVYAEVFSESSGRSRGCGIVEFATTGMANKAIRMLNDTNLKGRDILVREDREAKRPSRGGGRPAPRPAYSGGGGGGARRAEYDDGCKKLFVQNLPFEMTWKTLRGHFEKVGDVARADIGTHPDGRSKGWGVVEFTNAADAQAAIARFHGAVIEGRELLVREDRGEAPSGEAAPPSRGSSVATSSRVFVGNLDFDVTWRDLKDHMRQAGNVLRADIIEDDTGRSKGCGLVEYSTVAEAGKAIRILSDTELMGRLMFVREDREGADAAPSRREAARPAPRGPPARGSSPSGEIKIFVGNLPYSFDWKVLKDHFAVVGEVVYANVFSNADGRSRGFGVVVYSNMTDAEAAIERFDGAEVAGRVLDVRHDRE